MDLEGYRDFASLKSAAEEYVLKNIDKFDLTIPTIEGESKKIYRYKKFALIKLKPTLYSFTHNRYGEVEGTDSLRLDFWKLFATKLNSICPFISNYSGEVTLKGERYAITRFFENIPPLEVIWKNYLVGTMKHNLKLVDKYKTRKGDILKYEGKLPKIVRFDWRNPLPFRDECIPDEFADLYIDTEKARATARYASGAINDMLKEKGYELVDICYFMNYEGTEISSEITPDGMRIKKKGDSYDKDLWRLGKGGDTIISIWSKLYEDLKV